MGTETRYVRLLYHEDGKNSVKLNNPLMGTETFYLKEENMLWLRLQLN